MDNPNTAYIEEDAAASYLVLDNDYSEDAKDATPLSLMRATAAHEYNHSLQFGYDLGDQFIWYYEATASWMEIVTFPEEEDATHYIENIFDYPEICLGADPAADPTGGLLSYGSLLFIQSLVDSYGDKIPLALWENIAKYEGWRALEETISPYGDTIPQIVSRYHLKNLLRDYHFAPQFAEYTVWQENTISHPGEWSSSGLGIQELGANYFRLDMETGNSFQVTIRSQDDPLELWAVAITGNTAEIIALDSGAAINTGNYDHMYLMVFNPQYDDNVSSCDYSNYTITVTPGTAQMTPPVYKLNAVNFGLLD
jgi:hypothetical protein